MTSPLVRKFVPRIEKNPQVSSDVLPRGRPDGLVSVIRIQTIAASRLCSCPIRAFELCPRSPPASSAPVDLRLQNSLSDVRALRGLATLPILAVEVHLRRDCDAPIHLGCRHRSNRGKGQRSAAIVVA